MSDIKMTDARGPAGATLEELVLASARQALLDDPAPAVRAIMGRKPPADAGKARMLAMLLHEILFGQGSGFPADPRANAVLNLAPDKIEPFMGYVLPETSPGAVLDKKTYSIIRSHARDLADAVRQAVPVLADRFPHGMSEEEALAELILLTALDTGEYRNPDDVPGAGAMAAQIGRTAWNGRARAGMKIILQNLICRSRF